MKITFLSPSPNLSGGQRVIAIYARELKKLGHEVMILCSRPQMPTFKDRIKSLILRGEWLRLRETATPHYETYNVPFRVANHSGDLIDGDVSKGDVVVATFWKTARSLVNISKAKGRQFYLVQHDEGVIHQQFGAESTYELPLTHIYVSDWIAQRIRQRHPQSTGTTIPNAIECEPFDRGLRSMPELFTVGTLWAGDTIKGGDVAVEGVRISRDRGIPVRFIGFGTDQPPAVYQGSFDAFYHQPAQETLADIYGSCSVWLFTSRFEGFGLPILEAMAAGTPVIGTPTGAAPELIGQGGGELVPLDSPEAVADAIGKFATMNSDEWNRYSKAAVNTARSRTWQQSAAELEAYLLQVITI